MPALRTAAAPGKTSGKSLQRKSKPTLTPFGLDHGNTLRFQLRDRRLWEMTLFETSAEVTGRNYAAHGYRDSGHESGDISSYAFDCRLLINGKEHHLRREVGTQASFYEPWEIDGVRLWFDAAACVFKTHGGFMVDETGATSLNRKETLEALKYAKALYPLMIDGTLGWNDASNNKAFIAEQISLTANGVSI